MTLICTHKETDEIKKIHNIFHIAIFIGTKCMPGYGQGNYQKRNKFKIEVSVIKKGKPVLLNI